MSTLQKSWNDIQRLSTINDNDTILLNGTKLSTVDNLYNYMDVATPLYHNVKDFGAKGDNSTNDSAAFQAVLDILGSSQGTMFVPTGIYRLNSALTLQLASPGQHIHIIGEGKHQSRLLFYTTDTSDFVTLNMGYGTTEGTCYIEHLGFSKAGAGTGAGGILIKNGTRCTIYDCIIYGFAAGAGIKFDAETGFACDFNSVVATYVGSCQDGIELACTSGSYNNSAFIERCQLISNTRYNFYVSDGAASANHISDTWMQCVTGDNHGIYLADTTYSNKFVNVSLDGVNATDIVIQIDANCGRNFFTNVSMDGTYLDSAAKSTFVNCTSSNNTLWTGTTSLQGAPAAIADGDTAITAANLQARILTMASSTAGRAPTVPTGTAMNGIRSVGDSIDWTFINTGNQTVTITAATDHTLVGGMALAAGTQGQFRTRVSAANTAITYRLA